MRRPQLRARARVGFFALSGPFEEARFAAGVARVRALGFECHEPEELRARQGYLAGNDATRLRVFHELLDDREIDVLWAARGGYGIHRILDRIDVGRLSRANKPIVGFSDVTALHALVQSQAELCSIHGPVVTQLGDLGDEASSRLSQILSGEAPSEYQAEGPVIVDGVGRGPVVGGCLSMLVALLGTPYFPRLDGSILLLEDVGEPTYRIDRFLSQLRLAGALDGLHGIACGEFFGCLPQRAGEATVEEIFRDLLGGRRYPILMGLPFGHGARNEAVLLGAEAELDAGRGVLRTLPERNLS